jgi:LysR family glycine cleavage system transcriptional activator
MTYRLPSLNTLRAFEAAARHLSFKTASTELGVTAGAVSQQVRKLEQSLGVALFRRLPHGLLLTQEGETYLPKITKVFEDLTDATEEIAPEINAKKFSVGLSPEAAEFLPPKWPLDDDILKQHVRDVVQTSDVDRVRTDQVDCLIRLNGGPYRDLTLKRVCGSHAASGETRRFHFICKPGLADCRQTEAILSSLEKLAATVRAD